MRCCCEYPTVVEPTRTAVPSTRCADWLTEGIHRQECTVDPALFVSSCAVCYMQAAVPHTPIVLGRAALRRLRPGEVLVRRWPNSALPAQWFRLLDEDQPVVVGPCGHFFEAEEFEMVSREFACQAGGFALYSNKRQGLWQLQQGAFRTVGGGRVVDFVIVVVQAVLEHGCAPFSCEALHDEDSSASMSTAELSRPGLARLEGPRSAIAQQQQQQISSPTKSTLQQPPNGLSWPSLA